MKVIKLNRSISKKKVRHLQRKLRVRNKIFGGSDYPRMNIFRSNSNIYIQVIDDKNHKTLVSVSTYEEKFKNLRPTKETAKILGVEIATRIKSKGIDKIKFDRNGYKYHGVLAALVDSVREQGLKI